MYKFCTLSPLSVRMKLIVIMCLQCNTQDQLKNISQLRVVKYRYAQEFAERLGIAEDTGVIAQEVQNVLPDAVRAGGDIRLPNGEIVNDFLVVNKVNTKTWRITNAALINRRA